MQSKWNPNGVGVCRNCGLISANHKNGECPLPSGVKNWGNTKAERSRDYGDPKINQHATGLAFRAILSNCWQMKLPEIPDHVVPLLMNALKGVRAAYEGNEDTDPCDTYHDMHGYTNMAEDIDPRMQK
jgi:hypothetical protein